MKFNVLSLIHNNSIIALIYNVIHVMNMILSVKVKWGKENYPDIEVNTDEDPLVFKAQLFALTGVQPERQKVMLKGTTLKDSDWGGIKLKDVSWMNSIVHKIKHRICIKLEVFRLVCVFCPIIWIIILIVSSVMY
jgi:hypothetical protein